MSCGGIAVIVHVPDVVGAGRGDGAIALEARAAGQEDVAGDGVELVLEHARAGALHRLDQPSAGELRGAADQGDLAGTLDGPDLVQDRREVVDLAPGESRAEQLHEVGLARRPAVPVVRGDGRVRGLQLAAALGVPLAGANGV